MKDDFKNAKTMKRKKDTKLGLVDLIRGDFHDLQSVGKDKMIKKLGQGQSQTPFSSVF